MSEEINEAPSTDRLDVPAVYATNKLVVIFVGRQSYSTVTQEYKLIPSIDVLARIKVDGVVEAFEVYQHFLEMAEILNEDINQAVEDYNKKLEDAEDEGDTDVVDTSEEPTIDFASVFNIEENTFLAQIQSKIRAEGYSQVSVYLEHTAYIGEELLSPAYTFQPTDIEDISKRC